jgi:hypothetical protein
MGTEDGVELLLLGANEAVNGKRPRALCVLRLVNIGMVAVTGIEPVRLASANFKSAASTNSATPP